ncbi:MAG: RDD family protein [Dermatophilaceae bacterium]
MIDRRDVASWLQGPSGRPAATQDYPGQRLGLAPSGPGSIGRFGRRLVGLLVDWTLAQLVAWVVFRVGWGDPGAASFAPLGVFAVGHLVLVGTVGFTVGHRVVGLAVVSMSGGRPTVAQALIRTSLLCLAIPALIWDGDGRGLHDKAASTLLLRMGEPD